MTRHSQLAKKHTNGPEQPRFKGAKLRLVSPLEGAAQRPFPVRVCEKGEWICLQGNRVESLYVIREGKVLLSRLSADGGEIVLGVLGTGEHFGDVSLLTGGITLFNALAVKRTELLVIRNEDYRDLLHNPEACNYLITSLANRCHDSWAQIEALGSTQVQEKVRVLLSWLVNRVGIKTRDGIVVNLNQTQLAQMVGTTRETLNRALKILKKDGILITDRRRGKRDGLIILEPELLGGA
jgi:CRP/FNR family transcriptional regulator